MNNTKSLGRHHPVANIPGLFRAYQAGKVTDIGLLFRSACSKRSQCHGNTLKNPSASVNLRNGSSIKAQQCCTLISSLDNSPPRNLDTLKNKPIWECNNASYLWKTTVHHPFEKQLQCPSCRISFLLIQGTTCFTLAEPRNRTVSANIMRCHISTIILQSSHPLQHQWTFWIPLRLGVSSPKKTY